VFIGVAQEKQKAFKAKKEKHGQRVQFQFSRQAVYVKTSPEEQVFFALTLHLPTAFFRVMGKFFSQSRKRVYAC
jgi:hypothetical protein